MKIKALRLGRTLALAIIGVVMAVSLAACDPDPTPPEVVDIGFDTDNGANSYAWSMETFNGKVYIGTNRAGWCWEIAVRDYYFADQFGPLYPAIPQFYPELNCAPDPYDLPLRAQIWEYDPFTGAKTLVYESPMVANTEVPGKMVARYLGFRGMTIHNGALYVATASPAEFIPGLFTTAPPKILRSTDGRNFTEVAGNLPTVTVPDLTSGDIVVHQTKGYRSLVSVNGRLFATASSSLVGQGAVIEIVDPESAAPTWRQVSGNDFYVFQITAWENKLYLGVADLQDGYNVYRSASPTDLTNFQPLLPQGAGRGSFIQAPVSMYAFKGALYVGSNGYIRDVPDTDGFRVGQSELIRIYSDDRWDVVVGEPRTVNGVVKAPVSGLGDGFGNRFNVHFWRMAEYNDGLYLGTNDASTQLKYSQFGVEAAENYGYDLYASCDGDNWFQVTGDAFGSSIYNFGVRTMEPFADRMLIGSANHIEGATVNTYKALDCRALQQAAAVSSTPLAAMVETPAIPPQGLEADRARCAVELTWEPAAGLDTGATFVVSRAPIVEVEVEVADVEPTEAEGLFALPFDLVADLAGTRTVMTEAVGAYEIVGTTDELAFTDGGVDGAAYSYQVSIQTDDGPGHLASTVEVAESGRCG